MTAVVLAAGKGTRMQSDLPKVLHRLGGRPLVAYPVRAALAAGAQRVVVVTGHGGPQVRAALLEGFDAAQLGFVEQGQQNGTGHALSCALGELPARGAVLILSGDVPLLRPESLRALLTAQEHSTSGLALCVFQPDNAAGYGRIVRDDRGAVVRIREQCDASKQELSIRECNAGIYAAEASLLHRELPRLSSHNARGELYLTDLVELASGRGSVDVLEIDPLEAAGVNTPAQLSALERHVMAAASQA